MSVSLDEKQRRELWGIALCALALLLTLSLVPTRWFGSAGARLFAYDNIVGWVGHGFAEIAWLLLGVPALLLPAFPALWGLVAFERLQRHNALRWTLLLGGSSLVVPTALYVLSIPLRMPPPVAAGWLGEALGAPVAGAIGWFGASLLLTVSFAMLCVATVRWNPLRSVAGGGRMAIAGTRRAAGAVPGLLGWLPELRWGRRDAEDEEEEWEGEEWASEGKGTGGDDDTLPWAEATVAEPAPRRNGRGAAAALAVAAEPAMRDRKSRRTAADDQLDLIGADTGDPLSGDLPSAQLLTPPPPRDEARSQKELDDLGRALIDKLATFKVEGELVGMTTGPVVTQFEVVPAAGVKVARIASLDADLALAMRAQSIRILAPIPGRGAVGVEVPNPAPEMVYFREVIESPAFRYSKAQLPVALGKDLSGKPYVADLAKTPHLLIAGATGSGKSVCVNTIITSLIYKHSPRTLRLLMVDPKMVELSMYNDLPHLRHPVVTDNNDAAGVLKWAVIEMERRYALLSANGVRNLQDFNKRVESGQMMRSPEADGEEGDPERWIYKAGPLPYVVVIIDELADLMMTVQGEVEKPLALLAQKARAIGIHLILATQRPSVNVITGLIKANFPSRIAFRVSSKIDSRTILDQNGADALLGNGDMLFLPPGTSDPTRIQGAFLSTEETESLMDWYRNQAALRRQEALDAGRDPDERPADERDILDIVRASEGDSGDEDGFDAAPEDRDKLFREAAELCIQHQGGSTSLLQRRLRIGYGRAARIIDQLHYAGVLGPPDGSKSREVLVDIIGLDQICPDD
jgi:S-DNA-T family DNA segregation ATPase FtsK/SpoIIIE